MIALKNVLSGSEIRSARLRCTERKLLRKEVSGLLNKNKFYIAAISSVRAYVSEEEKHTLLARLERKENSKINDSLQTL